jgi:hypothetical protein
VLDAGLGPVDQHIVFLFPEEAALRVPESRRIGVAHTGTDGRFGFQRLPPGSYRLAVVTEIEPGLEFDAEFLDELARTAVVVALGAGETKTQDLRMGRQAQGK